MEELAALKTIIREEAQELICQTHPEVCALRDRNYPQLESLLLERLLDDSETEVSVQTALAELEMELAHL